MSFGGKDRTIFETSNQCFFDNDLIPADFELGGSQKVSESSRKLISLGPQSFFRRRNIYLLTKLEDTSPLPN